MAAAIDVAGIIDAQGLTRFKILLFALCAAMLFLDGFDAQMISYVAPILVREWHLGREALVPIFFFGTLGFAAGAMLFGIVADRFGRRLSSILCVLVFGLFSVLTIWAATPDTMKLLRFLAGLGLGGAMPNAYALLSEYFPSRRRATVIMLGATGYAVGASAGGLIAPALIPLYGWGSMFLVGGVAPLLLVLLLLPFLPESIRYLVARNRPSAEIAQRLQRIDAGLKFPSDARFVAPEEKAKGLTFVQLFKEGRAIVTGLLWLTVFMNLMVLYFLLNWLPTLATSAGMPVGQAQQATAMFSIGGTIGTLTLGYFVDRFGAWRVLALGFVVVAVAISAIGPATHSFALTASLSALVGVFVAGGNAGTSAFAGKLYPTYMRSTGVGWALGIGRAGALVSPLIVAVALGWHWDAAAIFRAAAIPALVAAAAIFATRWWMPRPAARGEPVPAEASAQRS